MRKTLAVLGALALTLVITSGGIAAKGLITGKDVKAGSLTGRHIKNGSLGSLDIRDGSIRFGDLKKETRAFILDRAGKPGPQGAAGAQGLKGDTGATGAAGATGPAGPKGDTGAQGPAGPQGATGPQGDTGASAFDTMPSGAVVRGAVGLDLQVAAGGTGDYGVEGSLTGVPSPLLDDAQVFVQTGTWATIDGTQGPTPSHDPAQDADGAVDTLCPVPPDTGAPGWWDQLAELTASPGNVCIYILESDHANDLIGFGRGYGFKLLWSRVDDDTGSIDPADNPDDMFVTGVWVYSQG